MPEIPNFKSLEEQALFWDTHDSVEYFEDTESCEIIFKRNFNLKVIPKIYNFPIKTIKKIKGFNSPISRIRFFQNRKELLEKNYLKIELRILT